MGLGYLLSEVESCSYLGDLNKFEFMKLFVQNRPWNNSVQEVQLQVIQQVWKTGL